MFQPETQRITPALLETHLFEPDLVMTSLAKRLAGRFTGKFVPRGPARASCGDLAVTTGAEGRLTIPTPAPTQEDQTREIWRRRGQKLARQEDWSRLAALLRKTDADRMLTPGGMSVTDLLARGARADVVSAAEHALMAQALDCAKPLLSGIEGLERVLAEAPHCPMTAALVASAHLDLGAAWWGLDAQSETPQAQREAFEAHCARAEEIMDVALTRDMGLVFPMSVQCRLLHAQRADLDTVVASFEHLVALHPGNAHHLRAFGPALLRSVEGDLDCFHEEAAQAAAHACDVWGAGGYAWILFDTLCAGPDVAAGIDTDRFIHGLHDILERRDDPCTVNMLAAFCAVALAGETGTAATDHNRATISEAQSWIISQYLTELHPMVWAQALHGFDETLRIRAPERFARRGADEAKRVLAALFLPELARGQDVTFTADGVALSTA